jgi:hypothetical protein
MISWPAGPRDTDGIWAKHWYASVWQSTSFQPYRPKEIAVPEQLLPLLKPAEDHYQHLYEHRLGK